MKKITSSPSRRTAFATAAVSGVLIALAGLVQIRISIGTGRESIVVLIVITMLVAWGLTAAALLYLAKSIEMREQQLRDEFNRELQAAREESFSQGFREFIKQLVSKSDVLNQIQSLSAKADLEHERNDPRAARLLISLMEELRRHAGLVPISVGTIVRFDPKQHRTNEQLPPGEVAVVVEPGWMLASDLIKMPVVMRRRQ